MARCKQCGGLLAAWEHLVGRTCLECRRAAAPERGRLPVGHEHVAAELPDGDGYARCSDCGRRVRFMRAVPLVGTGMLTLVEAT